MEKIDIQETYRDFLGAVDFEAGTSSADADAISAAILTLAEVIQENGSETLSHWICMGVRKGMFGVNATDDASINGSRQ